MSGHRTIDIRALHCPQCGAPAQVTHGENVYLCRFCQSSFVVERPMAQPPAVPRMEPPRNPYSARVNVSTPLPTPGRVVDMSPPPSSGAGRVVGVLIAVFAFGGIGLAIALSANKGGFGVGGVGGWDGSKPLVCSGNDWVVVDHVKAHFTSGIAIDASGNCMVNCKECDLSAPTVIRAHENASVNLDHGTASGDVFDEVTQNASVTGSHTKTTGKKNEPEFGHETDMQEWPSSGPYVCTGSNHVFKNVKVKVTSGAAIVGSVNCSLKLSNCSIEGPVGLLLNDNANVELDDCEVHATDAVVARANGEVDLEGGVLEGKDHAAILDDNANIHAHGAKVQGGKSTHGNATIEGD